MAEKDMPAAEATVASHDDEKNSYELAFHVLPTVAEGEVTRVFDEIKALITKEGAETKEEEAPERIDLVYEIVKKIEGKNRKFHSAYFGWVRFYLDAQKIEHLNEEIDARSDILRYIVLKLTKIEEANPFRFHEARKEQKTVVTVEDKEILTEATKEKKEQPKDVSVEELDESLEKITGDEGEDKEASKKETPKKEGSKEEK